MGFYLLACLSMSYQIANTTRDWMLRKQNLTARQNLLIRVHLSTNDYSGFSIHKIPFINYFLVNIISVVKV